VVIVDRLIGEPVELAGLGIAFDLAIETIRFECLEPGAKFGVLLGRQAGDGFFEVFDAYRSSVAPATSNASCPALCRASTSWRSEEKDVDGRAKPGHDDHRANDSFRCNVFRIALSAANRPAKIRFASRKSAMFSAI